MDLSFFADYINIIVMGICLCTGYVIKTSFSKVDNKYIPAIMLVLGTLLSISTDIKHINLELILSGMISGLSSTGLYELFKNMIFQKESE